MKITGLLILITVALVCMAVRIHQLEASLPGAVMQAVAGDEVLSAMRNARFECEKLIPRTQECILVYDYVPVQK